MDTGQAQFVYRYMAFIGSESVLAAEAAECAADQGSFSAYHDLLFENQAPPNTGYLTQKRLVGFAEQLGLDREQFAQCLASRKYRGKVIQSTEEATDIGVEYTPTVFINGRQVQDAMNLDDLRNIVLDELQRRS